MKHLFALMLIALINPSPNSAPAPKDALERLRSNISKEQNQNQDDTIESSRYDVPQNGLKKKQ